MIMTTIITPIVQFPSGLREPNSHFYVRGNCSHDENDNEYYYRRFQSKVTFGILSRYANVFLMAQQRKNQHNFQ